MTAATVVAVARARLARLSWLPPLAVRFVLGVTFVRAGWGKAHHLEQVTRYFASLDLPAPGLQAPFIAGLELVGGALLLAGLATRLVSLLLAATMAVALATAIWPEAATWKDAVGGVEAIYLAALVHLVATGAGAASLDRVVAGRLRPGASARG